MPADGTSAARCAHGDLGTSRLRAAEADVTRRLARVKEASRPANNQLRTDGTPRDHFSIRGSILVDQRSWSATSLSVTVNVRFGSLCGLKSDIVTRPKSAKLGHWAPYQITLSARVSKSIGTVKPIALAVSRLIASSNVVGCSTGKSAGLAPRSTLASILAT